MGHVEAQSLDHIAGTLLEGTGHIGKGIGGVELPGLHQALHVLNACPQLLLRHIGTVGVLGQQLLHDLIGRLVRIAGNDVIGYLIHHMDGTRAGVQHDVVAIELILMYHRWYSLLTYKRCRRFRRHLCDSSFLLLGALALLVGHAAAGLASRLAGGLALAAAAVLGALAQVAGLKGLDSFHNAYLHSQRISFTSGRLPDKADNASIIGKILTHQPWKVKALAPHRQTAAH